MALGDDLNLPVVPVPPPTDPSVRAEPTAQYMSRVQSSRPPPGAPVVASQITPAEYPDEVEVFPDEVEIEASPAEQIYRIFNAAADAPDNHTKALAVAAETGLPVSLVRNHVADWQKKLRQARNDPQKFIDRNPVLAASILRNPALAPAVVKDQEALEKMEQSFANEEPIQTSPGLTFGEYLGKISFKNAGQAGDQAALKLQKGKAQARVEQIAVKQWLHAQGRGPAPTAEELQEADDKELEMQFIEAITPDVGFLAGIPGGALEQLPRYFNNLSELGVYAGASAATGAAFGAAAGAAAGGVGALPGAAAGYVAGFGAGMMGGVFKTASDAEGALFYREQTKKGIDPKVALGASQWVAAIGGGLEVLPLGQVTRFVPGAKALLRAPARETWGQLIRNKTVGDVFRRGIVDLSGAMSSEAATELLQAATGIYHEQRVTGASRGDSIGAIYDDFFAPYAESQTKQSAVAGAQGGGGMHLASPFMVLEKVTEIKDAQRAQALVKVWEARAEAVQGSEVFQNLQGEGKILVKQFVEKYGRTNAVAVPVGKINEFFAAEGMSVEDVAKILPAVARQMQNEDAAAEVVIPTTDFMTHILSKGSYKNLVQDIREGDLPTAREAPEVEKRATKVLEEVAAYEEKLTASNEQIAKLEEERVKAQEAMDAFEAQGPVPGTGGDARQAQGREADIAARDEKRGELAKNLARIQDEIKKAKSVIDAAKRKGEGPRVFEVVRESLLAVEASRVESTKVAAMWQAFVETRAQRLGVSPMDYFKSINLTFQRVSDASKLNDKQKRGYLKLFQADDERLSPHQRELRLRATEAATPEERQAALDELVETLITDELTGANTQSAWQRFAPKNAFGEYVDPKEGFYLAIDVNDLKRVNDAIAGHAGGDVLLQALSSAIGPEVRKRKGKFFRSGGDEFMAHFRTRQEADDALAAINEAVSAMPALFDGKHKASVSVGLAAHPGRADAASMRAKEQARAKGRSGFGREGAVTNVDLSGGDVFSAEDTNTLDQKQGTTIRGQFETNDARDFMRITLTGKANLSTFTHESGHAFLALLERDAKAGHAQSVEDLKVVTEWMGITGRKRKATIAQLEQFARGFEAYVWEGKAPSARLAQVFDVLKGFMRKIYATLRKLDVELTPEVREVMDRLLATDMEIQMASDKLGVVPLSDESGLFTPEEYAAYRGPFNQAFAALKAKADRNTLRDFKEGVEKLRATILPAVTEAAKNDPNLNVRSIFTSATRPDGQKINPVLLMDEGHAKKLDRDWVKANLDADTAKKLAKFTISGGLDPDLAATVLGLDSGADLMTILAETSDEAAWIKAETDRRMEEEHPGYRNNRAWQQENAYRVLHSAEVGNAIWAGMVALSKKVGGRLGVSAKQAIKRAAERKAGEMTMLELRPSDVARAEARSSREAAEAWKKGDVRAALDATRRQLFYHYLWRNVDENTRTVKEITKDFASFKDRDKRRRLAKGDDVFIKAIDRILEIIEFGGTLEGGAALTEALTELRSAGLPVLVPSKEVLKEFQALTVADLKAIHESIQNLEHLAREETKAKIAGDRATHGELVQTLAASIRANGGLNLPAEGVDPATAKVGDLPKGSRSGWDKAKDLAATAYWHLQKMEIMIRMLDGGQTAGLLHQNTFQLLADAEAAEHAMFKEVFTTLREEFKRLPLKDRMKHDKRVAFLTESYIHRDVLMIAFNMRNAGNAQRLMSDKGWEKDHIIARLDELLTDDDIEIVNKIGTVLEKLGDRVSDVYKRAYGVEMPRVQGDDITLASGRVIKGGYFPIMKDPRKDKKSPDPHTADLWDNDFVSMVVGHGFTEDRAKEAETPLWLDLDALPHHLVKVIHYVTHYEATQKVDRIFRDPAIRKAIEDTFSHEALKEIRPWLMHIVRNSDTGGEIFTAFDAILRHTRVGATTVLLGGRLTSAMVQGFGITMSAKELSMDARGKASIFSKDAAKYLALGVHQVIEDMGRWMKGGDSPFAAIAKVNDSWVLHRENMDRDLRLEYRRLTSAFAEFGHARYRIAEFSMFLFNLVQGTVNAVTYHAALRKAQDIGHADPQAYANSVVRLSQSSGGPKDLAGIQRGPEAKKLLTVMYSFANLVFGQLAETNAKSLSTGEKITSQMARLWWIILAPAALAVLLQGDEDELDDPEAALKAVRNESITFAARSMPIVGDFARSLTGRDAKAAPWLDILYSAAKPIGKMTGLSEDERDITDREVEDLIRAFGVVTQTPTGAGINAYNYALEFSRMEDKFQNAFFRSPRNWR